MVWNSDELSVRLLGRRRLAPARPAARAWLARPFPRRARQRIAMVYVDDQLAWPQLYPLLRYRQRFAADGIAVRGYDHQGFDPRTLPGGLDAVAVQAPYQLPQGEIERLLAGLRAAQPGAAISFLDWFAPTDIRFSERVAPYVDRYFKKGLLRDRSAYLRPTVGHTQLTDHFAVRLGTDNPPPDWRVDPAIVDRLAIAPAFATGPTMLRAYEAVEAPPHGPRPIDLHARIAVQGTPWYQAMRQEAADAVARGFPDLEVAASGRITRRAFLDELRASKLCFSPFGYGELCWRDYEAVLCGAVLVKPDMGHVEAHPDIFTADETYIAVRWDLADLEEKVRDALRQPERLRGIAEAAYRRVRDYLVGGGLEHYVGNLLGR